MSPLLFSAAVSVTFALSVVGAVCWFVGGWLMLRKVGRSGWLILVPFVGPYQLFKAARSLLLFVVGFACVGLIFLLWLAPWAEVQQFWAIPLCVGVVMYAWGSLALAQSFHLGAGWQILAFVAAPYFYLLVGASKATYDETRVPPAVAPFWPVESLLYDDYAADLDYGDDAYQDPYPAVGTYEGPKGGEETPDADAPGPRDDSSGAQAVAPPQAEHPYAISDEAARAYGVSPRRK